LADLADLLLGRGVFFDA
jgi:hypothetical protein